MAKASTPAAEIIDVPLNELVVAQDFSAANSLALASDQQNERVTALAQQLDYRGSTDLGALENSARDATEYLGKSIYALGTCLLLLKEGTPRGQFLPTLERLGIGAESARRYMAMSRRFANTSTSRYLEKLGFSKMTELLPLDDEQIEALSGLGQTGELVRDDVATMSVKELRAAVRKERLVAGRMKTVNDELNTELALSKNLKIAATDWPERFKGLMDQAQYAHKNIRLCIGSLDAIRITATEDEEPADRDQAAALQRAREVLADELLAIHRKCADYLDNMGVVFDQTLGCFASEGR
jgi:hypothetical protein